MEKENKGKCEINYFALICLIISIIVFVIIIIGGATTMAQK